MVSAGGEQFILGGVASGTEIVSGGVECVGSGGVDSGSTISNGGQQIVSGGAANSDTVASGGAQNDYGVTSNTTILRGGAEHVFSAGVAYYSQVYGAEFVSSGGAAYGDTVHSGGVLTVSSGGFVSGGLTISGSGTANISGTVGSGQDVVFSGAGDLALSNLSNFHALIGGYSTGDELDLGGFASGSGETLSFTEAASLLSGTLGVHDGGLTASLTLLGKYVTSDFALSTDGHGGSFVKFV